jgi:outer membrane protein assembly factor BamB
VKFILSLAFTLAFVAASACAGDTWPAWRGPTGQGITEEKNLPLKWNGKTGENILWKVPLPGAEGENKPDLNQSSPIVWKDRVIVAMAYWPKGTAQSEYAEHRVACYAVAGGKKLWESEIKPGPWKLKDLRGGYAAPTPATDGERIYVLFGSSVIAALDLAGKELWRKEIAPYFWDVCLGSSPVLFGDTVLVLADGTKPEQSRLIAFDKKTGDIAWEKARPKANFNHSTPLLIEVKKQKQLVVAGSSQLQGVDPTSGKPIWWVNAKGDVPTPAFADGIVYSEDGRGGPAVAVDPTGEGDVTATNLKWKSKPIPEGFCSPTIAGEYVYRLHRPGVLKCLNLKTGEEVYSERLPGGVESSASPILTPDGKLIFASGGKSIVVPVGPKFEIIETNELNDISAASPAVANGKLFIKGAKNLYCIGKE